MFRSGLVLLSLALAMAALAGFSACSSSSSSPAAASDAGGSDSGDSATPPPGDGKTIDDAGLERFSDGGLTVNGCQVAEARIAQARIDAKTCTNVPSVCKVAIKDECGCATFLDDPQSDDAKRFGALVAVLFGSTCTLKCAACTDPPDSGSCQAQASGPMQCTP